MPSNLKTQPKEKPVNRNESLKQTLKTLHLTHIAAQYERMAQTAAADSISHVEYLQRLVEAEAAVRYERSVLRRTRAARLPVLKTIEQFDWTWPKKINKPAVTDLFRLRFIEQNSNAVIIGGVGLGKTHLAIALAHEACLSNIPVLFTSAVEIVNHLAAAQATHTLHKALKDYLKPRLLIIDELGFVPMDKDAADLFFQVVSARYERSATLVTTNIVYTKWAHIFDNNSTIASAILDRLLHHCQTITIEGTSYRMQNNTHNKEKS